MSRDTGFEWQMPFNSNGSFRGSYVPDQFRQGRQFHVQASQEFTHNHGPPNSQQPPSHPHGYGVHGPAAPYGRSLPQAPVTYQHEYPARAGYPNAYTDAPISATQTRPFRLEHYGSHATPAHSSYYPNSSGNAHLPNPTRGQSVTHLTAHLPSSQQLPAPPTTQTRYASTSGSAGNTGVSLAAEVAKTQAILDHFKRRPLGFYREGRVFKAYWAEPAGDSNASSITVASSIGGERVHTKIRVFLVLRAGVDYCTALAINSHERKGVVNRRDANEHGMIYTGRICPEPLEGEEAMQRIAIQVNADHSEKLLSTSRVHYGKIYNVEFKVKVKSVGNINRASWEPLMSQFRSISPLFTPPLPALLNTVQSYHPLNDLDKAERVRLLRLAYRSNSPGELLGERAWLAFGEFVIANAFLDIAGIRGRWPIVATMPSDTSSWGGRSER